MDKLGNKELKFYFGLLSILATAISIASIANPYWINFKHNGSIGLFESTRGESDKLQTTSCSTFMSEMECGYLYSSQVSGVISIIFGGFASATYFLPPKTFARLPTFVAISGSLAQCSFSIMTIIIFFLFKKNYLDDDGINKEYPSPGASDLEFAVSYYLWVVAAFITLIVVTAGYILLSQSGKDKKTDVENDYMMVNNERDN